MISSSGTASQPLKSLCPQRQATKTTGQYGPRTVRHEPSHCGGGGNGQRMQLVKTIPGQSSSGYSKTDIVKKSLSSRVDECRDAASWAIYKYDELNLKCRKALGISFGFQYCKLKFDKVFDSRRNMKVMGCHTEEDGHWLKKALLGPRYYPGYFVYSTSSNVFNANGEMKVDGEVPMCGDLAVLYAKGLYGPGKKELAQCKSMDQLQELMRLHGVDAWKWHKNRSDKPKETHAFHSSDFSKPISALVHQYWDMPCGERKVFLLETEKVKKSDRHAMVIMLEKKTDYVMVLRHYDPNWTNSCQKVILNNPDHADRLELKDLYSEKNLEYFFQQGVAKLTSLETVHDKQEADYYWYSSDKNGQAGLRLSVEGGLWFRCKPLSDSQERSDYDQRRQILEDDVVRIITEEVFVGNKSEAEKEAIIEYFLREMRSDTFREKIFSQLLQSNLSAEFKLRNLESYCFQNYRDLLPIYPSSPKDLLGLGPEELAAAFTLAVTNSDPGLAEFAVIAAVSDDRKSEEDRVAVLDHFKFDAKIDRELQQRIIHHLLQSNLSVGSKLKCLKDFPLTNCGDNLPLSSCSLKDLLGLGAKELIAAFQIALVNNDPELAELAVIASLSDDSKSEEERVAVIDHVEFDEKIDNELQRRIIHHLLQSNLSVGSKLKCLKDFPLTNCGDNLPLSSCSLKDLLGLGAKELIAAFQIALVNNDPELAELAVIASLSDDSKSEEERVALLLNLKTDARDIDKELQRRVFPIVLTSNLSLRFKLEYFEDFVEEYQDYFNGFRDIVSESLCRESPPTDLADGLRLALYLNDVKLAGNIIDMVVSDDDHSEEEKIAILDLAKTSPIHWGLVKKNVDVVKCYLSGILESSLSDAHKVELSRMGKIDLRSIVMQALLTEGVDMAHSLVGIVANSKMSPALKEKIVDPKLCLEVFVDSIEDPHDKQVKEMIEMLDQLIMEKTEYPVNIEKEVLND